MITSVSTATITPWTHLTGSWLQHDCPYCVKWAYNKMPCASQNNANNFPQDYPECLTHPPFSQELASCSSHFSTLWKMYLTVRWKLNPITWTTGILLCDKFLNWYNIYIINQQDATLAVLCLLKTTSMLYMFRTPFASIFRSTINCNSSHWCLLCYNLKSYV